MQYGTGSEWDRRLVRGVTGAGAPAEASDALIAALGGLGCEAEFGLALLHATAREPRPDHALGEQWLRQCLGVCQRVARIAAELELAVQSYTDALLRVEPSLVALARGEEFVRDLPERQDDDWTAQFDDVPDVWWPESGAVALGSEPIELWLRRAGFPYRHAVTLGLPEHVEVLADALGLALHALHTLPPRGVITRASLYLGLQALTAEFGGDLVPHHLADIDTRHVGLATGVTTLLRLGKEPASLAGDIAWARAELDRARALLADDTPYGAKSRATRPLTRRTGNLWARQLVGEWERTLATLESLRGATPIVRQA